MPTAIIINRSEMTIKFKQSLNIEIRYSPAPDIKGIVPIIASKTPRVVNVQTFIISRIPIATFAPNSFE